MSKPHEPRAHQAPTPRSEKAAWERLDQGRSILQLTIRDDGALTPRQYAVLLIVSLNDGIAQTHLVEKTGIDRSTLADIVRRMLKKGLLQRRRTKEDARAYAVKLTDGGWKALKAADPVTRGADARILTDLPARRPASIQTGARRDNDEAERRLEAEEILRRVTPWAGSYEQARSWFRGQGIPAFGDQTAESLVGQGRADDVRSYLDGIAVGGHA